MFFFSMRCQIVDKATRQNDVKRPHLRPPGESIPPAFNRDQSDLLNGHNASAGKN